QASRLGPLSLASRRRTPGRGDRAAPPGSGPSADRLKWVLSEIDSFAVGRARSRSGGRAGKPKAELKIEGLSAVMLGSFNPQIFQPAWMASNGLLDPDEAAAAEIAIIHRDVVSFSVGTIAIDVTREKFQAETTDATDQETLRDLVTGSF